MAVCVSLSLLPLMRNPALKGGSSDRSSGVGSEHRRFLTLEDSLVVGAFWL